MIIMEHGKVPDALNERRGISHGIRLVLWKLNTQCFGFTALPAKMKPDGFRLGSFLDGDVAHQQPENPLAIAR